MNSPVAGTRILMLAPEPVLRPRGTPLSVAARLRALSALGCRVDLVTYPFGERVCLPGVAVHRCGGWPVRREPLIGPSPEKIVLDAHLAREAWRRLRCGSYDVIHTHEEAAFLGAMLARRWGLPHLYDMHSSLPEQMVTYGWFRRRGLAVRLARRAERWLLRRCDTVIAVYPAQARAVRAVAPDLPVVLIENPPLTYTVGLPAGPPPRPVPGLILYTGNMAANQGLDVLLSAMRPVADRVPSARLMVIGGRSKTVARARRLARRLGVIDRVEFRGIRSPAEALAAHRAAAVLVSPRTDGPNVPSKIYTYLSASRPIVATDVPAHRQVIDEICAVLVPPTAEGLADGLVRVLTDAALAGRLAEATGPRLACHFSADVYRDRVGQAVAMALAADR